MQCVCVRRALGIYACAAFGSPGRPSVQYARSLYSIPLGSMVVNRAFGFWAPARVGRSAMSPEVVPLTPLHGSTSQQVSQPNSFRRRNSGIMFARPQPGAGYEVCVIGGGLAGATAALQLARRGCLVTVVDMGRDRAGECIPDVVAAVAAVRMRLCHGTRMQTRRLAAVHGTYTGCNMPPASSPPMQAANANLRLQPPRPSTITITICRSTSS